MKLVGLMPVRNEAHILGYSARVALQWCDVLIIHLHACTDASGDIAAQLDCEFPNRVVVMVNDSPTWDEMNHRQDMLAVARHLKATHVAIVDCDEVVTANLLPTIRTLVERTPQGQILQLPLYNLRGGIGTYHANGLWGNRIVSVAFADDPRLGWLGDKFHAREPVGWPTAYRSFKPVEQGAGGVMHYWGSSERRLRAKHSMYKVTERLRWPDKPVREIDVMYSQWRDGRPAQGDTPDKWLSIPVPWEWTGESYLALMAKHLHNDAEPWQERAVRDIVAEHPEGTFKGLDLFGLDDFGKFGTEHPHQHMSEVLGRYKP